MSDRAKNLGNYSVKGGVIHDRHPSWKGDQVSYTGIHMWVARHRGKASVCVQCGKYGTGKYIQWANISGEYKRELDDYESLCGSCHKKQDYERKYGNACMKGHEFTAENTRMYNGRRICKECQKLKMRRIRQREKIHSLHND
jgi:hypothetical protein